MTQIISKERTIVASGFAFAENPRWHDGRLYFADIHGGSVYALGMDGAVETIVTTPDSPSGIGFQPDGSLLVVAVNDLKVLRWKAGELSDHADLTQMAKFGLNDMLVDPEGGAYAVQYGFDWRAGDAPVGSALLRIEKDGSAGVAAEDLVVGNGMALSADGLTFLIAESAVCRVTAFDRSPDGRLSNRRIFAQLPEQHYPDGICLDSEGGAWVSCCWGPGVVRVTEGGEITHLVPITDGRNAFACCFGGPDRRTLYICTAAGEDPHEAMKTRSSRIEALDVGFVGAGLP